ASWQLSRHDRALPPSSHAKPRANTWMSARQYEAIPHAPKMRAACGALCAKDRNGGRTCALGLLQRTPKDKQLGPTVARIGHSCIAVVVEDDVDEMLVNSQSFSHAVAPVNIGVTRVVFRLFETPGFVLLPTRGVATQTHHQV